MSISKNIKLLVIFMGLFLSSGVYSDEQKCSEECPKPYFSLKGSYQTKNEFDVGLSLGASHDYLIKNINLLTEIEGVYQYRPTEATSAAQPYNHSTLTMLNLIVEYPLNVATPFVGYGIGVKYANFNHMKEGEKHGFKFAQQYIGGLKLSLTEKTSFLTEVKYNRSKFGNGVSANIGVEYRF